MNKNVLVADDDDGIRSALREVLQNAGYTVSEARNGAISLALVAFQRPGTVILDLRMPIMNGWEMIRELRQGLHDWTTPVIAHSSEVADPQQFRAAGFTAFLRKGSSPQQILCTARTCLGEAGVTVTGTDWLYGCDGERCRRSTVHGQDEDGWNAE